MVSEVLRIEQAHEFCWQKSDDKAREEIRREKRALFILLKHIVFIFKFSKEKH